MGRGDAVVARWVCGTAVDRVRGGDCRASAVELEVDFSWSTTSQDDPNLIVSYEFQNHTDSPVLYP